MSIPRIIELSAGLATGMLGIIVGATIFKDDFDTSRRIGDDLPLLELLITVIFFTVPNLLVAIGAYFHVVRRDSGPGRLMIFFGSAFVVGLFLLFEIIAGYRAMYRIGLRFWPVVLTLITAGSCFAVRGKSRRHNDA